MKIQKIKWKWQKVENFLKIPEKSNENPKNQMKMAKSFENFLKIPKIPREIQKIKGKCQKKNI